VQLASDKPQLGRVIGILLEDHLYKNENYEILQKYVGEPKQLFNYAHSLYQNSSNFTDSQELLKHTQKEFAKKCIQLIDYSRALNKTNTFNYISKECLSTFQETIYEHGIKEVLSTSPSVLEALLLKYV